MLQNDFFTIQSTKEIGEQQYMTTVKLDDRHKIYEGHFPDQPVTPGVCTLQIVKECAQNITGKSMLITNIASCKYTGMILPRNQRPIDIIISLTPSENQTCSCRAEVRTDKEIFMKLKCTFSIL